MKLEKPEYTQKKKTKKALLIGGSTVAIVTFLGITGWGVYHYVQNNAVEFAKSFISGKATRDIVAAPAADGSGSSGETGESRKTRRKFIVNERSHKRNRNLPKKIGLWL